MSLITVKQIAAWREATNFQLNFRNLEDAMKGRHTFDSVNLLIASQQNRRTKLQPIIAEDSFSKQLIVRAGIIGLFESPTYLKDLPLIPPKLSKIKHEDWNPLFTTQEICKSLHELLIGHNISATIRIRRLLEFWFNSGYLSTKGKIEYIHSLSWAQNILKKPQAGNKYTAEEIITKGKEQFNFLSEVIHGREEFLNITEIEPRDKFRNKIIESIDILLYALGGFYVFDLIDVKKELGFQVSLQNKIPKIDKHRFFLPLSPSHALATSQDSNINALDSSFADTINSYWTFSDDPIDARLFNIGIEVLRSSIKERAKKVLKSNIKEYQITGRIATDETTAKPWHFHSSLISGIVETIFNEKSVSSDQIINCLLICDESLRSCRYLWYEDDLIIFAILRIAWESLAKIITYNKNVSKYQAMKNRTNSPTRWLESAGLKRINKIFSILNITAHQGLFEDPIENFNTIYKIFKESSLKLQPPEEVEPTSLSWNINLFSIKFLEVFFDSSFFPNALRDDIAQKIKFDKDQNRNTINRILDAIHKVA